jgi:hypothetical protein
MRNCLGTEEERVGGKGNLWPFFLFFLVLCCTPPLLSLKRKGDGQGRKSQASVGRTPGLTSKQLRVAVFQNPSEPALCGSSVSTDCPLARLTCPLLLNSLDRQPRLFFFFLK